MNGKDTTRITNPLHKQPTEYVNKVIERDDHFIKQKMIVDGLNRKTAEIMRFKKVHLFMGKLCIQKEGDVANNNIPWSPATNANDAVQILDKFRFTVTPVTNLNNNNSWRVGSDIEYVVDENLLIAICKSLIAHAELG